MRKNIRGFTIVELIIAIIVIAILITIGVVSYNGVSRRALDSAIQADLRQAVTKIELFNVEHGKYPTSFADLDIEETSADGNEIIFSYEANNPDNTQYCVSARSGDRIFYATQGALNPSPGSCNGSEGEPGDGTVVVEPCNITDINITINSTQMFSCTVPEGMDWLAISEFTGSGGSGDGPAMYVKRDSEPTKTSYDCRDTAATYNTQQCIFHAPQAGDYHIMLNPIYGGNLVNGRMEVTWGKYGEDTVAYTGSSVTVSGDAFSRQSHSYEVPAGTDYLVATFLGGASDTGMFGPSLALKHGSRPGIDSANAGAGADCNSYTSTYITDQCIIMNPSPGKWYIETYAYQGLGGSVSSGMGRNQSYSGVVVEAITGNYNHTTHNYTGPVQVSGGAFARESYKITVPAGAASLTVKTSGGTYKNYGAALAVKQGSRPGAGSTNPGSGAQCNKPTSSGNANTCVITSPLAGDYYMEVYSYYGSGGSSQILNGRNQSFTNTTLTATIE